MRTISGFFLNSQSSWLGWPDLNASLGLTYLVPHSVVQLLHLLSPRGSEVSLAGGTEAVRLISKQGASRTNWANLVIFEFNVKFQGLD